MVVRRSPLPMGTDVRRATSACDWILSIWMGSSRKYRLNGARASARETAVSGVSLAVDFDDEVQIRAAGLAGSGHEVSGRGDQAIQGMS